MQTTFNPYQAKGTVLFARMRSFVLGKQHPTLFTRIICNLALLYFFYVFLWTLTIFLAFNYGQNLPKAHNWNELLIAIGKKYDIEDIHFSFSIYLFSLFAFSAVLFAGVLMVWRRKMTGYLLVITGSLVCTLSSVVILGTVYVKYESTLWEFIAGGLVTALFTIDYFLKRKRINL